MITAVIQDNKLIVTRDNKEVVMVIYKYNISCDGTFQFKLNDRFKLLNALFTLPKSYIVPPPRPIQPNTEPVSKYRTSGYLEDCPYMMLERTTDDGEPLSDVTGSFNEVIQLYQSNFNYTFCYQSDGYIEFLFIILNDRAAYPVVDIFGNTIHKVKGRGKFTIGGYWGLIIIRSVNQANVKLKVTGRPYETSLFSTIGDVYIPVITPLGEVQVKVATKFQDATSTERIPVRELYGLSELLFAINRLQAQFPCNINVVTSDSILNVNPPPPIAASEEPNPAITSVNLVQHINSYITTSTFGGRYIYFTYTNNLPNNPYIMLGNLNADNTIGEALLLVRDPLNNGTQQSTYRLNYDIALRISNELFNRDSVGAFWMASQYGAYFNNYNPLCNGSGTTQDSNPQVTSLGNNEWRLTYQGSFEFDTTTGNFFWIGIYLDPDSVDKVIEVDTNNFTLSFVHEGPCNT